MLRLLDTFSGIGGFSFAAEHLVGGYQTVAFVERDPFCQKILCKHWPDVPIHNDITTFTPKRGSADVVCGGFPCQDISTAGKQAGIKEGTRSGLFYELMRVIRLVEPRFVIMENVSAILANGLDIVLGELASSGFDAEWACIPASAVGACHQRDRWWLVAYPSGQQRHDLRATRPSQQAQPKPRDGDGADGLSLLSAALHCSPDSPFAAYSNDIRSPRSQLSLSSMCGSYKGREAELGSRQALGAQPWPRWAARGQSLNPDWRSYVSQPVLRRGDDGLSNRVDRLKALGNAVVPQVAAIPLARVKELAAAN